LLAEAKLGFRICITFHSFLPAFCPANPYRLTSTGFPDICTMSHAAKCRPVYARDDRSWQKSDQPSIEYDRKGERLMVHLCGFVSALQIDTPASGRSALAIACVWRSA
jgi:hypothetical protein